MGNSNTQNDTGSETHSAGADFPKAMIPKLRVCVSSEIPPARVSSLLRTGSLRLLALRDKLEMISSDAAKEEPLAGVAENLKNTLASTQFESLQGFSLKLRELERLAATGDSAMLAATTECRVLLTAAMQNNQAAANLCRDISESNSLETSQRWQFAHLQAKLLADHGQAFDDDKSLQASIDVLKSDVLPLAEESGTQAILAASYSSLGDALGMIGQHRKGTRYLEDAIDAFTEALEILNCDTAPMQWASVQNGLGNALGSLGQRSSDEILLERSIEAFEQALTRQSEESCPYDWASTMNNLAAVLQSLGRKRNDSKLLKRSVNSYKAVLRVWTRSEAPLDWATTMDNLGTALRHLGEHRRGPGTLKQAVAAYNSALAERYRELVPDDWAMTHNNLGAALQKLAQREESSDIMQRATESYETTLTEWTREKTPMTWAMTTANLGVARRELAQLTGDIETAHKSVEEIQSSVDLFRSASHAQYTELGEEQLSKARLLLETLIAEESSESPQVRTAADDISIA